MDVNPRTLVDLAGVLFDDARKLVSESTEEMFAHQLDLCLTALAVKRATGEDAGVRGYFMNGFDILRANNGIGPWIYDGAAHLGWLAIKLSRFGELKVGNISAIDDVVVSWIEDYPRDRDVDLPQGALGLGVYGLSHPSSALRTTITSGVLDIIEDRLETDGDDGFIRLARAKWRVVLRPNFVGLRDLGVAHGNTGLAAYLAMAALLVPEARPRALGLLTPVLTWLVKQRVDMDGMVFPQTAETRYEESRSAWCYGDPGVSIALCLARDALPGGPLCDLVARSARDAAEATIARPRRAAGVVDTCLCHGAGGLCHLGRRIGELFPELDASEYVSDWSTYVEDERRDGPLRYVRPESVQRDASFLEGDCGVALALLSCATGDSSLWEDRIMTALPQVNESQ